MIADPQLIDSNSYPGRPFLLKKLSEHVSDRYLYHAYSALQKRLRPDTTVFLGDLLDGGRECPITEDTEPSSSLSLPPLLQTIPLHRPPSIDAGYWGRQYKRFNRLFVDSWRYIRGPEFPDESDARQSRLIYGLPGNHDIGFGYQINKAVAERFERSFGPSNRVDIIGNHTFVSVDSLSLSAIDQADKHAPRPSGSTEIWKDAMDFLQRLPEKRKAVLAEKAPSASRDLSVADFPAVLLSHVPLWRKADTPCGPLREKRSAANKAAIRIGYGHQYQNVLTESISEMIVHHIGTPLSHIFSGDDHDYCEIVHDEYPGAPREVTVKSASMAMGIRKPAYMLLSLWNPVDQDTGKANDQVQKADRTIKSRLCILPDQIGIYEWYGQMAVVTFVLLLGWAMIRTAILGGKPSRHGTHPTTPSSAPSRWDSSGVEKQTPRTPSKPFDLSFSATAPSPTKGLTSDERLEEGDAYQDIVSTKNEHSSVTHDVTNKNVPFFSAMYRLVPSSFLLPLSRADLRVAGREVADSMMKIVGLAIGWYIVLFLT